MNKQPRSQNRSDPVNSRNTDEERSGDESPQISQQDKPASGLAIASLVCGVGGLLFCGIPSIVGFILGIVAMKRIKNSQGRLGGHGLALAGTIVSAIAFVIGLFLTAMLLPALARARAEAQKTACMNNLKNVATAMIMYQNKHGSWPDSLIDLHPKCIDSKEVFRCPADDRTTDGKFPDSYIYRKPSGNAEDYDTPVVFDRPENHSGGRCVLFADKHIEFVPAEKWQKRWPGY